MTDPQPAGLTPEQVARYWDDGFLIGVPVLAPAEVREARETFLRIEAEERVRHGGTWPERHFYPWQSPDHPMRGLYHRLALHPRLIAAVTAILGPDVLIRNADVFVKEPGVKRTVAWHLDTAMRDGTENAYLTAWIGLSEGGANATNGGLKFLRGGHRMEIPDRPTDKHHLTLSSTALRVVTPDRVVQTEMPSGHASFHHACMPHFSGPDLSSERRIGFVVRFMGAGVSPEMAESGSATVAAGRCAGTRFSLSRDFPVTWSPQVP
jgi:ectoine hydroxylase-related dioxygenase (phytanoyl-CoA dioxygenase family)